MLPQGQSFLEGDTALVYEIFHIVANKTMNLVDAFGEHETNIQLRADHTEAEILSILKQEVLVILSLILNAQEKFDGKNDQKDLIMEYQERFGLSKEDIESVSRRYSMQDLEALNQGTGNPFERLK